MKPDKCLSVNHNNEKMMTVQSINTICTQTGTMDS